MDTDIVKQLKSSLLLPITILIPNVTSASQIEFQPKAGLEVLYSDNIDLEAVDEQSEVVTTLSVAALLELEGAKSNLSLEYDGFQTLHARDSSRNELFHELSLAFDHALYRDRLTYYSNVSITNIARSIRDNANADIITGDTIETRNADMALVYAGPSGGLFDLSGQIFADVRSNQDDIGDNYGYGADIGLRNGSAVKHLFWSGDYSYNERISRTSNNGTESYSLYQEVGLQQQHGLSPFMRVFYENHQSISGRTDTSSGSFGPGLRYYFHRNSYLETSYDFSFNDEDFFRGALFLNPTPRTSLRFDYTKRFFGDAYEFDLSHRNKRVTNEIRYTEEVTSFDRTSFIDGQDIEELRLSRELSWTSRLALKRATFELTGRGQESKPLSGSLDTDETVSYGGGLSVNHRLSSRTSVGLGFDYDRYDFENDLGEDQTDDYTTWDVSLDHTLNPDITIGVSLQRNNRDSTNKSAEYTENRANLNIEARY